MPRHWILAALALAACGDERPPPPRDAAQACFAAIDASTAPSGAIVVESLVCRGLYRDRACGAAWSALGHADNPPERLDALQAIRDQCRRACIALSGGAPPRSCLVADDRYGLGDSPFRKLLTEIMEIDRGLHQATGFSPDEAARLSTRLSLLTLAAPPPPPPVIDMNGGPPGAIVTVPPPPPTRSPLFVPLDDELVIEVTLTDIRVNGATVDDARLQAMVRDFAATSTDPTVTIAAATDVEYARIVALMDKLRAAGITNIHFEVHRP